ncbi:MAG: UDP-N-acetylmuramoyl-L-alanine--D-glutamate ligase [Deltaproteobacteria bacterium]|nr:UDP-N-acetylmuramoyl-L-alanine--D-glutamate ligase [Deltaproteobacteria bacterium]
MDLLNKKVLIVGFGKSGQAALRYCLLKGARPAVADLRDKTQLEKSIEPFKGSPVDWYLGLHDENVFTAADLIVVSPGIPWRDKALEAARKKGIPVLGEMELALQDHGLWTMDYGPKTIAVTGTNGKTTTVSLIHHLLTTAGRKSLLAGNVGKPLLDCLEEAKQSEFLVLEISSYQMEAIPSLKPDVAVWLNITEDHLDWHTDFNDYVMAKSKLIQQTAPNGLVIYNGEDDVVSQSVEQIPSSRLMFSTKRQLKLGGWMEEGGLNLKTKFSGDIFRFALDKVSLKGIHNWENMLATLLSLSPYVNDNKLLQKGLESFTPLPHRMQLVREFKGVTYINDSKGTNVGAALKAIASTKPPIVWIAGGKDKGGSYAPLRDLLEKKSKKNFLFGEAKQKMAKELKGCGEIVIVNDLKEAVGEAAKIAISGDTVLFSPACSSFDMFKDYADRGNKFAELVASLQ